MSFMSLLEMFSHAYLPSQPFFVDGYRVLVSARMRFCQSALEVGVNVSVGCISQHNKVKRLTAKVLSTSVYDQSAADPKIRQAA